MRIGAPQRMQNYLIAVLEYGKHYGDMNAQAINKKSLPQQRLVSGNFFRHEELAIMSARYEESMI
jgi:hypothetical protein